MPLIPLDIPPGVVANGTDLEASGRWRETSLVRWRDGSLRPVGGWRTRVAELDASGARAMLTWQDGGGNRRIALGMFEGLYVVNASGAEVDITPDTFTAGDRYAAINVGYGGGFYGLGFYGTQRPDGGNFGEATTWSLDNWGFNLVACSTADGKIHEWPLTGVAAPVSNAPESNLGILVTEERFLFALGAGGNPRKVQWSDREDNTTWTPAATNEAGDLELQTSGQIMAGVRARGQALIVTDVDAHAATYIGPPFVYGFARVGTSCGLASRKAITANDAGVFWMGTGGFYRYDGTSVQELPCAVHDRVFRDINRSQISTSWAMTLGQFGEVWFFYPSGTSGDPDRYVAFDYNDGHWLMGELSRTCGADAGAFRLPLMLGGPTLYDHEVGANHSGAAVYAETGPVSLGAGDRIMSVNKLIPDEKTQGDVTVTFKTRLHPNDVQRAHGPYQMANPTSVRFTGRQMRMRVDGNDNVAWNVGIMRVEAHARGER